MISAKYQFDRERGCDIELIRYSNDFNLEIDRIDEVLKESFFSDLLKSTALVTFHLDEVLTEFKNIYITH
jgi:hypothetical protein